MITHISGWQRSSLPNVVGSWHPSASERRRTCKMIRFLGLLPLLFLLACDSGGSRDPNQPQKPSQDGVLVAKISGMIDQPTVAFVHRALRVVEAGSYQALVLDIDTPGGLIDSMNQIESALKRLSASNVITVAYVSNEAFSAGAYIAFSCKRTYMAERSSIGAITPVIMGPAGVVDIPDADVRRKSYSAMRTKVRALLELRPGHTEDLLLLGEAMVDPDMRVIEVTLRQANGLEQRKLMSADRVAALESDESVEIISQQPISQQSPISLTAGEALEFGFSSGTYGTLEEMVREEFGVSLPDRLEPNWSEATVSWLDGFKPVLFVLGFLLLVIEAKTPGIFVPGVMGVLLIGLGFFSSYLVGLADWTEILLFGLGLTCIFVEILVLPGTFIFGLAGFISVVFALILSQQHFVIPENAAEVNILQSNVLDMFWLIVLVIAGAVVLSRYMPRIPWFNRILLSPPEKLTGTSTRFTADEMPRLALAGVEGVTLTDLRPAGSANLGADRYDVVSQGGWIEKGQAVRVVEIQGNRIVVESCETGDKEEGAESGVADIGLLAFLVIVGIGLVIAEVFFVSFGVLSICAAVSFSTAIFLAFLDYGPGTGISFLIISLGGAAAAAYGAIKYLPNTRFGKALILSGDEQARMRHGGQEPDLSGHMDQRGEASSDLRPAGFAILAGKRVDVVTRGEMIEKASPIKVIEVEGNRVVVTLDTDPPANQQDSTTDLSDSAPGGSESEASTPPTNSF